MLDYEKVARQFAQFARLSPEEAGGWTALCTAATDELCAMVRPGTDWQLWGERLTLAAAGLALCRYLAVAGCGGQELRLGDFTVKDAATGEGAAARLRQELLEPVRPVLKAQGPVLFGVG